MADFKYKITEEIAVLSKNEKGYSKELNLVSYNDADAKFDIRTWYEDEDGNKKLQKGITLNDEECKNLYNALKDIAEEKGW